MATVAGAMAGEATRVTALPLMTMSPVGTGLVSSCGAHTPFGNAPEVTVGLSLPT